MRVRCGPTTSTFRLLVSHPRLVIAYLCPALKQDRLCTRSTGERKCTHSFRALIFIGIEHLVQALVAKCFKKPFARLVSAHQQSRYIQRALHIRAWKAFQSSKLKGSIFCQHWPTYLDQVHAVCKLLYFQLTLIKDDAGSLTEGIAYPRPLITYFFRCTPTFLSCDFLWCSLDLWDVDCSVLNLNDIAKNSFDLCQFVLVPSDEIQSLHSEQTLIYG